jgi:putative alpha-1,2-mannosidase
MKLKHLSLLILFLPFMACKEEPREFEDLTGYVDPFIGTDAHGHTFPGPTSPFRNGSA